MQGRRISTRAIGSAAWSPTQRSGLGGREVTLAVCPGGAAKAGESEVAGGDQGVLGLDPVKQRVAANR